MDRVSKCFVASVKLADQPAYVLAQKAGVDPSVLSKLINGIIQPRFHDDRVVRVGEILGLSADECFDQEVGHAGS